MVTVREAYRAAKHELTKAGIPDAAFEAGLLLQGATGFSRFDDGEIDPAGRAALAEALRRRAGGEPLQYILGSWPFMGLELAVGPGVLIPRPETEEVCLAAIKCLGGIEAPHVLDLCAGSGALALGVCQGHPGAEVTAVELESRAYAYLTQNAARIAGGVKGGVRPVQADALLYWQGLANDSLDLVVSNPPYVTEEEYAHLAPELYHEPRSALVAPEQGLQFYRAIARDYRAKLKPGGWLVFEIGAAQGPSLLQIFAQNQYRDAEIRRDINGNPRIALGARPVG